MMVKSGINVGWACATVRASAEGSGAFGSRVRLGLATRFGPALPERTTSVAASKLKEIRGLGTATVMEGTSVKPDHISRRCHCQLDHSTAYQLPSGLAE